MSQENGGGTRRPRHSRHVLSHIPGYSLSMCLCDCVFSCSTGTFLYAGSVVLAAWSLLIRGTYLSVAFALVLSPSLLTSKHLDTSLKLSCKNVWIACEINAFIRICRERMRTGVPTPATLITLLSLDRPRSLHFWPPGWSVSDEPYLTVDGLPTSIFMRMGPFGMKARVSQVKQRGGKGWR